MTRIERAGLTRRALLSRTVAAGAFCVTGAGFIAAPNAACGAWRTAAFFNPGGWGRSVTTTLDSYESMAGMWIVGEDMPQETNRVTLNMDLKDQWGLPVANVHFSGHANDIAMRNHAYKQGRAINAAVGATRTFPTPPNPSTHNLGTNWMSENPEDGVCKKWGQTHDIANLFISERQPVHDGCRREPDADNRRTCHPAGRPYRQRNGGRQHLKPRPRQIRSGRCPLHGPAGPVWKGAEWLA